MQFQILSGISNEIVASRRNAQYTLDENDSFEAHLSEDVRFIRQYTVDKLKCRAIYDGPGPDDSYDEEVVSDDLEVVIRCK